MWCQSCFLFTWWYSKRAKDWVVECTSFRCGSSRLTLIQYIKNVPSFLGMSMNDSEYKWNKTQ